MKSSSKQIPQPFNPGNHSAVLKSQPVAMNCLGGKLTTGAPTSPSQEDTEEPGDAGAEIHGKSQVFAERIIWN